MADELNIPTHRWYEPRNNIRLPNQDFSRDWIYDSGIQKINAWINSQPWGNPVAGLFALNEPGIWLDPSDVANLDWRRNLLTYTEQFDNAAWLKDNASIVANPAIAPDGTATADQLVENTATGLHDIYTLPATQPVGTFTYSLYVKASGRTKFRLQQTSVTAYGVLFDLVALTATSVVGGAVGSITNVGSGWYRCSLTYTTVASFAPTLTLFLANDAGSISYTGDNASGVIIWGAQLELGSVATDYQRISDVNTEVLERFPTTTMFQDRAGSTAVTTPGQSVGLRLDKSKGLVLGSELLANGAIGIVGTATAATYSTSTGAGTVSRVDASNQSFVRWSSLNSNSNYKVRVTCTSGNISIRAGDVTAAVLQTLTVGQTFDAYLMPVGGFLTITHAPLVGTSGFTVTSVKELPGNHAVANSDAARGIYGIEPVGGRRNLLTFTEQFDSGLWSKTGGGTGVAPTVTANAGLAPDGTMTADRLDINRGAGNTLTDRSFVAQALTASDSVAVSGSVYLKAATSGDIGKTVAVRTASASAYVEVTLTADWVRFVNSGTTTARTLEIESRGTISGSNAVSLLAWGAQLETGSTATAYQRVVDQYNVTEAGKQTLHYVQYDGSDDGYVTPTISPESALVVSGSELVTNGDFAVDANWTKGTGWTIGSGAATTASGGSGTLDQTVTVVAGRPYRIDYTITGWSSGQAQLGFSGGTTVLGPLSGTGNGTRSIIVVAATGNNTLRVFKNTSLDVFSIDNISVREMSGAADKVQVFAGVRKLSDAATGVVIEHSVTLNSNAGTFFLLAPNTTASTNAIFASKGSLPTFGSGGAADIGAAPVTRVLSGIGDIAADTSILRMNGTQVATSAADQGTGNFLAYPLYIGRRGGTTLPFNGRDYGICVRFGANLDASTISATENYMAQKTGVTL